jgi:peptide chain release factor-like protein
MHPARLCEADLLVDCRRENTRGSGPGGQHRNRVATAVRLTHTPTGLMGQASERRSQKDNARVALARLRLNLALDYRSPLQDADFDAAPGASKQWKSRVRGGKIRCNPAHGDFPALVAEVLDLLNLHQNDVAKTAAVLEVSVSQLIKFLAVEPRALNLLNQARRAAGQHPYR